jgi:hypothetical protein
MPVQAAAASPTHLIGVQASVGQGGTEHLSEGT